MNEQIPAIGLVKSLNQSFARDENNDRTTSVKRDDHKLIDHLKNGTALDNMTNNFPLLNQIDEGIHLDNIDWNKNAFQTLLVS
jgi:hypothetical protein